MVNVQKLSFIFGKGARCGIRSKIQKILGFRRGSIHFRYLWSIVEIDRLKMTNFEPLIAKIRGKIST